ncbi:hypothetical protein V499_03926 [Pseudogymnoascus sp. VKM F-103]|nr:hypothetical protein V499_03926 [Pseudogymnoascus sp. VKM F-103]
MYLRTGNLPPSSLPRILKKNRQLTYLLLLLRSSSTPSTSKQRSTRAGAAAGTSRRPPTRVPSPAPPGLPAATARSTGSGIGTRRASARLVLRGGDGFGFTSKARVVSTSGPKQQEPPSLLPRSSETTPRNNPKPHPTPRAAPFPKPATRPLGNTGYEPPPLANLSPPQKQQRGPTLWFVPDTANAAYLRFMSKYIITPPHPDAAQAQP